MKERKASRTAEGTAAVRARESLKPSEERICYDPFARYFLSPKYLLLGLIKPLGNFIRRRNEKILPGMFGGVVARTRYIDDYLTDCLDDGLEQLVILGAGFDSRAYRFESLRNLRVFEVDHPSTQKVKRNKIQKILVHFPSHVTYVPMRFDRHDLSEKLSDYGYCPTLKTLFIWEGVTMYLTAGAVDKTLGFISKNSAPGSSVIFDYCPPSVAAGTCGFTEAKTMMKKLKRQGEPFTFGLEEKNITSFLASRGFDQVNNRNGCDCKKLYFMGKDRNRKVSSLFSFVTANVSRKNKPYNQFP